MERYPSDSLMHLPAMHPQAMGGSTAGPTAALHHPHGSQDGDEPGTAAHALYVRTHGAFAPGEQRRRPYDWAAAGVDPAATRFGAVAKADVVNAVGKALNPGLDDAATKEAKIVSARVEEHRLTNGEVLGAPRRLGAGDRSLPPGFTFGKPSLPKVRPHRCPHLH